MGIVAERRGEKLEMARGRRGRSRSVEALQRSLNKGWDPVHRLA